MLEQELDPEAVLLPTPSLLLPDRQLRPHRDVSRFCMCVRVNATANMGRRGEWNYDIDVHGFKKLAEANGKQSERSWGRSRDRICGSNFLRETLRRLIVCMLSFQDPREEKKAIGKQEEQTELTG